MLSFPTSPLYLLRYFASMHLSLYFPVIDKHDVVGRGSQLDAINNSHSTSQFSSLVTFSSSSLFLVISTFGIPIVINLNCLISHSFISQSPHFSSSSFIYTIHPAFVFHGTSRSRRCCHPKIKSSTSRLSATCQLCFTYHICRRNCLPTGTPRLVAFSRQQSSTRHDCTHPGSTVAHDRSCRRLESLPGSSADLARSGICPPV